MRLLAGLLLALAAVGCGSNGSGTGDEPRCYYYYEASYSQEPVSTASPLTGCSDPR